MTEHSICHPGRPRPQGDGHEGSPGFEAFQSAKSAADRRPVLLDKVPAASVSILTIQTRRRLPSPSSRRSRLFLLHGSSFA